MEVLIVLLRSHCGGVVRFGGVSRGGRVVMAVRSCDGSLVASYVVVCQKKRGIRKFVNGNEVQEVGGQTGSIFSLVFC